MQVLFEHGVERGNDTPGLGEWPGVVTELIAPILPHMGWNDVQPRADEPLFRGLEGDARFYFLHSYFFEPASEVDTLASADYGGRFVCGVRHGRIHGVQFHPEKSHQWGIQLLKNFAEM